MTTLTGTWQHVQLGLRRDRILLPVWLVSLSGLTLVSVSSVAGLYTTEQARQAAATFSAASRLSRALDGPASGSSLGALTMVETFSVLAILVGLMSIQLITRQTRQDEETGRAELLRSTVAGRHAGLTAALLLAIGANVAVAAVASVTLISQDLPLAGSLASGAGLGAVGVVFAAVAAVTAQVSDSQRGANGMAAALFGGAWALRAVGDATGHLAPGGMKVVSAWPSWLSPVGWGQQVRPFSEDQWAVFWLFGTAFLVLAIVAFVLAGQRDIGAGLVATRPGPAQAAPNLSGPLRLAWRLQRGAVLGWTVGLVALGAAFGALGDGADELAGVSDELASLFETLGGASLTDAYFAFVMGFLGLAAAAFTVQSLLRARGEEASGRLEPILAAPVNRGRWLLANACLAAGGTAGMLALAGTGAALSYGAATGDVAAGFKGLGAAALIQVPAALGLGGFVVAMFGLAPTWAVGASWTALAASLVMGQLGPILKLPQAAMNLSPFTHVPAVPAEAFVLTPVVALLGVAAVLGGMGVIAFRRRDLAL